MLKMSFQEMRIAILCIVPLVCLPFFWPCFAEEVGFSSDDNAQRMIHTLYQCHSSLNEVRGTFRIRFESISQDYVNEEDYQEMQLVDQVNFVWSDALFLELDLMHEGKTFRTVQCLRSTNPAIMIVVPQASSADDTNEEMASSRATDSDHWSIEVVQSLLQPFSSSITSQYAVAEEMKSWVDIRLLPLDEVTLSLQVRVLVDSHESSGQTKDAFLAEVYTIDRAHSTPLIYMAEYLHATGLQIARTYKDYNTEKWNYPIPAYMREVRVLNNTTCMSFSIDSLEILALMRQQR